MQARRILCLLLSIMFVSVVPVSASATSVSPENNSLNQVIDQIQSAYPSAQISVENGEISVFVSALPSTQIDMIDTSNASIMAIETTITAPEGGLWTSFKNPWYTYINPDSHVLPYCVVFLPEDRALDLYLAKTTTGLWDFILENPLTGAGVEAIAAQIFTRFGLSLSTTSVIFLYSASMLYLYDIVNINSFANAIQAGSGAVRIDYTTLAGWPVNYYYAWNGITVTDSPWQDFSPVFHRGIYSTADL